ncbi:hypothetical protein Tco_1392887 [Tanacetum coccineum]
MTQHEFITLSLAQFGQILKIPYNDQAVFTKEWDLASLAYSQETEGSYHTYLPTPDDICRFLQLERVELNRVIKSQNFVLTPNQILTKESRQDMRRWEELIRENVFGLGGNRDHVSASLAHMLYCIVAEEQYNLAYFFVKRIECRKAHLLEDKQIPSVGVFDEVYFAFGRHLEELHVTWAHLEKKRTRLRTYTNITQDNVLSSWRRRHQYNVTPSTTEVQDGITDLTTASGGTTPTHY